MTRIARYLILKGQTPRKMRKLPSNYKRLNSYRLKRKRKSLRKISRLLSRLLKLLGNRLRLTTWDLLGSSRMLRSMRSRPKSKLSKLKSLDFQLRFNNSQSEMDLISTLKSHYIRLCWSPIVIVVMISISLNQSTYWKF